MSTQLNLSQDEIKELAKNSVKRNMIDSKYNDESISYG